MHPLFLLPVIFLSSINFLSISQMQHIILFFFYSIEKYCCCFATLITGTWSLHKHTCNLQLQLNRNKLDGSCKLRLLVQTCCSRLDARSCLILKVKFLVLFVTGPRFFQNSSEHVCTGGILSKTEQLHSHPFLMLRQLIYFPSTWATYSNPLPPDILHFYNTIFIMLQSSKRGKYLFRYFTANLSSWV